MKRLLLAIAIIGAFYVGWGRFNDPVEPAESGETDTPAAIADDKIARAYQDERSGVQVTSKGVVTKILDDDSDGSRHQRFILRLESGQTLLISHNIDLAPRVPSLNPGDTVAFNGEYEWNKRGGVIHWTHRDPNGQHAAGWLKHDGETYQ